MAIIRYISGDIGTGVNSAPSDALVVAWCDNKGCYTNLFGVKMHQHPGSMLSRITPDIATAAHGSLAVSGRWALAVVPEENSFAHLAVKNAIGAIAEYVRATGVTTVVLSDPGHRVGLQVPQLVDWINQEINDDVAVIVSVSRTTLEFSGLTEDDFTFYLKPKNPYSYQ